MGLAGQHLWLILCSFLVLFMQVGFLLLEGGRVRSKNSINVAQKNISDLVMVWVVYFTVGFYFMFSVTVPELVKPGQNTIPANPLHFVYQLAFCCTTATIVSGAIAERFKFRSYLYLVILIAGVIYPFVGRMAWGEAYNRDVTAWLGAIGFIDFAGSSVVHGVGAWIALVAILLVGPRSDRFDSDGNVQQMPAHSSVMALAGTLTLFVGWMGFNGGALLPGDELLPLVLFSTLTSGIFGGFAGMIVGVKLDNGIFNPTRITSGLIGGLVASTAGVHFMNAYEAMIVGVCGGAIATYGAHFLLHNCKLDDPLDVVATHGLAGIFGTLAVAFLASPDQLINNSRMTQLLIQAFGAGVIFLFVAASSLIALKVLDKFVGLRVDKAAEKIGLNYAEHGEGIGTERLQESLQKKIDSASSYENIVDYDVGDEHSELAATLNELMQKFQQTSMELENSHKRFLQFAETASDWLWETDEKMRFSFFNANSETAEDSSLHDIVGSRFTAVLDCDVTTSSQLADAVESHTNFGALEMEIKLVDSHNTARTIFVDVRGVPRFNSDNEFIGYRGSMSDISTRKQAEGHTQFLAEHDELTALPNRRTLSSELSDLIAAGNRRRRSPVVLALDLDGFKQINDAYGHQIGDELLIKVAERMRDFLRPDDIAFRTGGDEFVIILNSLEPKSASRAGVAIGQRLIAQISEPYILDQHELRIGVSVGLAAYPEHGLSANLLLSKSDLALYKAKDRGKGCVVAFYQELDNRANSQLELENALRSALDNNQMCVMYQPQVDTQTLKVTGYEALLRWTHPEFGIISPQQFVPIAERLNLMSFIGHFVLETACAFASGWNAVDRHNAPQLSVNVSAKQLLSYGFTDRVFGLLSKYDLPAERLELEISESSLAAHGSDLSNVIDKLADTGVLISLDEFGRSHSSLRYLDQLPLTTLKLDRTLISIISTSESGAEIAQTIVSLGKKMGISVLASGVESQEQLNLLRKWQCERLQGFLFSEPVDKDGVIEQIRNGNLTINEQLLKSA